VRTGEDADKITEREKVTRGATEINYIPSINMSLSKRLPDLSSS
jgi:hypothetical protein